MVAGANAGHPDLSPISIYAGAMKARSAGRATLRDANPDSLPLVDPRHLTDPDGHDEAVLLEARAGGTVHGINRLYVADASLMPTIDRGNSKGRSLGSRLSHVMTV